MESYQLNTHFQLYEEQVSGKQPKLLSDDRTKLLKGLNDIEKDFYVEIQSFHISHPFAAIRNHIPRYYGIMSLESDPSIKLANDNHEKNTLIWLNHLTGRYKLRNDSNKFIVLQNLTHGWELPNIFDIKIGGRNVQGKKHKITKAVSQYFLKLNGCKMHFATEQHRSIFLSKYYLAQQTEVSKFLQILGLFFFNGSQIQLQTIKIIREKLQDLILCFKSLRGFKFISSSACIIYDCKHPTTTADIKLLDFGRVTHCSPDFIDDDSLYGLINIHKFLTILVQMGQKNNEELKELQKFYSETDMVIVPEKKKIKYNDNIDQSPIKN